jgi:hypothetical protein
METEHISIGDIPLEERPPELTAAVQGTWK